MQFILNNGQNHWIPGYTINSYIDFMESMKLNVPLDLLNNS